MIFAVAALTGIFALAIGFLVAAVISRTKLSDLQSRNAVLESKIQEKEKFYDDTLRLQRQHEKESLEAMQGRFDETIAKLKAELENATSDMLKKRQAEFVSTSSDSMTRILEPLNMSLAEMRKAVNENTMHHSKLGGQLENNLQLVMQHSDAARRSADRLTEALKGGGKVQGDWGETVLTELLESQGLKEGVHFDTQSTLVDERGKAIISEAGTSMRPDVILHLDKKRDVVIDAKVSLSAFIDYVNAEDETGRTLALKKHVESIEKHVKELSKKDYSSYVTPPKTAVNYVIMFVPTTAALHVAANTKTDLWRKAMEQGVYIADEQTLYAALRIIDMTWRQISQAENHEKVYKLADEMLDRVTVFMEKFTAVGNKLNDAQKVYEEAYSKLKDSGTSIPVTCKKLIKMGVKSKKKPKGVDPELLGYAALTEDEAEDYPVLPE